MPIGGWDINERELFGTRYFRCRTFLESVLIFAAACAGIVWILVVLSRDDRSLFWAAVPVSAMLAVALLCVAFISVRWLLHSRLTFAAIESTALRSQFRELTLDFLRLYSVCLGVVLLAVFMAYAMLQGTR